MTSLEHLGPRIPPTWTDPPPFAIHALDLVSELNGLGEAIVRMQVTMRDGREPLLLIAINPRSMQIIRVRGMLPSGSMVLDLYPRELPGMVIDLAVTKVWETFGKMMVRR